MNREQSEQSDERRGEARGEVSPLALSCHICLDFWEAKIPSAISRMSHKWRAAPCRATTLSSTHSSCRVISCSFLFRSCLVYAEGGKWGILYYLLNHNSKSILGHRKATGTGTSLTNKGVRYFSSIMSLGTRLFVWICPALLPPHDPTERDFYDVLDVPVTATPDDIRKAYRKLSLQLHPDKVAQRGQHETAEQAAAEYEQVQQAYAVLIDPEQRQLYHSVGRSPQRWQFLSSGGAYTNPVALYENLSKASMAHRARLVLLLAVLICIALLQPILIAAKVNAVAENDQGHSLFNTKWTVLLIPLWVLQGSIIAFWMALVILVPNKSAKVKMVTTVVEQLCWMVGFVLVAKAWDDEQGAENWHVTSIPFYLALVAKIYSASSAMSQLRREQKKMVSLEFLQTQERDALTEERLVELAEDYIIVTVDGAAVDATIQVVQASEGQPLSAEDIEAIRVQSSTEYEINEHIAKTLQHSMTKTIFVAFPFVALIASRLEEQITCSWWIVFLPIWIYFALQLLGSCFACCFVEVTDDDEVILMEMDEENDNNSKKDPNQKEEEGNETKIETQENKAVLEKHATDDEKGPAPTSEAVSEGKEDLPEIRAETVDEPTPRSKDPSVVFARPEGTLDEVNQGINSATSPDKATDETREDRMENGASTSNQPDGAEEEKTSDDHDKSANFEFDEEAFHAWKSAYAKAEKNEMEKQAKAQTTCCLVCFQVGMVCLIVGKLDEDFDNEEMDASYSAFWVLFPVFFIAGVLLCCCSCLIYGAGAEGLDELVERTKSTDGEEGTPQGEDSASGDNAADGAETASPQEGQDEVVADVNEGAEEDKDALDEQQVRQATDDEDMNDLD